MAFDPQPLAILLQLARGLLRTAHPSPEDLRRLLNQTMVFLEPGDREQPEVDRYYSETAALLVEILGQTQDQRLRKLCMQMLLQMDCPGDILATAELTRCKVTKDNAAQHFAGLEPNQRLRVLHRFFLLPRGCEPALTQWAFEAIAAIQNEDPEEVLLYLNQLPEGTTAACPIQNELLRGRFGLWLRELLKLHLDSEQIEYMADTAGRLESRALALTMVRLSRKASKDRLPSLLRALTRCSAEKDQAMIRAVEPFLKHPDKGVQVETLQALGRLNAPGLTAHVQTLYTQAPSLRQVLRRQLFQHPTRVFREVVKGLAKEERPGLLFPMIRLLAALHPEQVLLLLESGTSANKTASSREAAALKECIRSTDTMKFAPVFKPSPPKPLSSQKPEEEEEGLFSNMKKLFGGKTEEKTVQADPGLLTKLASGQKVEKGSVSNVEYKEKTFTGSEITGASLSNLDLAGGEWKKVQFKKCRIKNVDFSSSRFSHVTFEECDLRRCSFSEGLLEKVRFSACTLTEVSFTAATLKHIRTDHCLFDAGGFWGTRLADWNATGCQFLSSEFSCATLSPATLNGVEFRDCRFHKTYARKLSMRNALVSACVFQECMFLELDSDEPCFMEQEWNTFLAGLEAATKKFKSDKPPLELCSGAGQGLMYRILDQWFLERDIKTRQRIMSASNRRRLEWGAAKLGKAGADYLAMLPGLVEADVVKNDGKLLPVPVCAIHGYKSDYAAQRLLTAYLAPGKGQEAPAKSTAKPIPIEALYTIGSVGTVAQGRGSDIDMWLCYEGGKIPTETLEALKTKLSLIEAQADASPGLEIHFFLMDLDAIRRNDFGFSDKESAGSTQAKLLKEEFYRTVLVLAGKTPAWWCTTPNTDETMYEADLKRIASARSFDGRDIVDLGPMEDIPREEFFGASLWQIVKALKSPFKSVMKFALLEKYYARKKDGQTLICNLLKDRLLAGERGLWETDPYAVMFREVYEFYQASGNKDAQKLMRLAFQQKTGCAVAGRTTGRAHETGGSSYMEFFFPHSEAAIAEDFGPAKDKKNMPPAERFADLAALGTMVSQYMFRAYEAVQKQMRALDMEVMVTEEDMTKLGRKIMSCFQPRENKIMHLSFINSPKGLFGALEFVCEGVPGTAMTWVAKGEPLKAQEKKAAVEEIRREKTPARLFAWLMANEAFSPKFQLRGSNLQAPVSIQEVKELMEDLHDFFPYKATFDTDIAENVKPERVLRAFILVNFLSHREDKRIKDVSLIYSTSWGEMFCLSTTHALEFLEKSPNKFIKANIDIEADPAMHIKIHTPRKAHCLKLTGG
jgi:adenylate cyclase, class 1